MNKNKSLLLIGSMMIFLVFDIKLMSTIMIDFGLEKLHMQINEVLNIADFVMHTLPIYLYFETVILSILLMIGISLVISSLLVYWGKRENISLIYKRTLILSFSIIYTIAILVGIYALVQGSFTNYMVLFFLIVLLLLLVLADGIITFVKNHKRTKLSVAFGLAVTSIIFTIVGVTQQYNAIQNQTAFYEFLSETIKEENEEFQQYKIDTNFYYLAPKGLLVGPSKIGVVIIQTVDEYEQIKDIKEVQNYINSPSINIYLIIASMFGIAAVILKDDELDSDVEKKIFKRSKDVEAILDKLKSSYEKVKKEEMTKEEYNSYKEDLLKNIIE